MSRLSEVEYRELSEYLGGLPLFPRIIRRDSMEQRYERYARVDWSTWISFDLLKHQYFQLLSDLLPITVIMLNRDCKV